MHADSGRMDKVVTENKRGASPVITAVITETHIYFKPVITAMSGIAMRKVKGKAYYYLEESVKAKGKWRKESAYLGGKMPSNDELRKIFGKFERRLGRKGIRGITPPLTRFVTRSMAARLSRAAKRKDEYLKALSPEQRREFARRERITFVTDSNAIEGSTLDFWLTEQVLSDAKRIEGFRKRGIAVTNFGREEQEAMNLDKCLGIYEKWLKDGEDISEEMILRLHFILLSKIDGYEKYRGVWRPVNVMIRGSTHVFPHHSEVPGMMHGLLKWYHENKGLAHPVELAARFHTKFTSVHPFADGNGRMARLLMNYILQANGMPFTNIPLRRRAKYMKTQEAGNVSNDKPFVLFLSEEVIKQGGRLKKR